MSRPPVDLNWFTRLRTPKYHQPSEWLSQLRTSVESLASFGCMSSEPFYLMWTLDAGEVKVTEVCHERICERKKEQECLEATIPLAFKGRTIDFILADMRTVNEDQLPPNHFDLAFCERVLYQIFLTDLEKVQGTVNSQNIQEALQKVLEAINQMARIVKPGGWVIAVETIAINPGDDPRNISPLFKIAGLCKEQLEGDRKSVV